MFQPRVSGASRRLRVLAPLIAAAAALAGLGATVARAAPTATLAASGQAGSQAARDAYFKGDFGHALALAQSAGERWIGGLSAYRFKNYPQAVRQFAALAADPAQNEWVRAAGGFWAARAAAAAGDDAGAKSYLKSAASHPHTFYGLIAERRLSGAPDPVGDVIAGTPHPARAFSAIQFPTPNLAPTGGFTVSKALVYALVRQESRFNAAATGGGAYGLMQLTPATAARVAGDDKFKRNPARLHDEGLNLRLGQVYVAKLLGSVQGDLLRAMAAYNYGPGILQKLGQNLGDSADTLLMIESFPGASTREFVEKVMTNYWIYREIFGLASPSLDAASGSKPILASLDD